jgi:hypothetical protein
MNAILVIFVMLVASLTTILTMDIKGEGFSLMEVPNIFDLLTSEENGKLKLLNDTTRFRFDSEEGRIQILMPTVISNELRIIGKNAGIRTTTGSIGTMPESETATNQKGRYMIISVSGTQKNTTISPVQYGYSSRIANTYIPGYPPGYFIGGNTVPPHYSNLDTALYHCDSSPYCQGITYNPNLKGYSLRGGSTIVNPNMIIEPKPSPYGEHSYIKKVNRTF